MCAVDGKTSLIVIKLRRLPRRRCVTLLTIVAEVGCFMIRIVGRRKPGAVTRETIGCRIRVPTAMTVLAGKRSMGAGQSETCRTMIEIRRLPGVHVVAGRAVVIKIPGCVIGFISVCKS